MLNLLGKDMCRGACPWVQRRELLRLRSPQEGRVPSSCWWQQHVPGQGRPRAGSLPGQRTQGWPRGWQAERCSLRGQRGCGECPTPVRGPGFGSGGDRTGLRGAAALGPCCIGGSCVLGERDLTGGTWPSVTQVVPMPAVACLCGAGQATPFLGGEGTRKLPPQGHPPCCLPGVLPAVPWFHFLAAQPAAAWYGASLWPGSPLLAISTLVMGGGGLCWGLHGGPPSGFLSVVTGVHPCCLGWPVAGRDNSWGGGVLQDQFFSCWQRPPARRRAAGVQWEPGPGWLAASSWAGEAGGGGLGSHLGSSVRVRRCQGGSPLCRGGGLPQQGAGLRDCVPRVMDGPWS